MYSYLALELELDVRVGDLVDGDLHAGHLLPRQLKLFGYNLGLHEVPFQVTHPRLRHLLLPADRGQVQAEVADGFLGAGELLLHGALIILRALEVNLATTLAA